MSTALTQPEHTMVTPTCSLNLGGKMADIDVLILYFFRMNFDMIVFLVLVGSVYLLMSFHVLHLK